MDCRGIEFSPQKSDERIQRAMRVFDSKILIQILAFALYMFGAKRRTIATIVGMPDESVKTVMRVVLRDGFQAFVDRRKSQTPSVPKISIAEERVCLRVEDDWIIVDFNSKIRSLRIPATHKVQVRTVLLSLLNSELISIHETSSVLGISEAHCRELAKKLACDDIEGSLIDKRRGQLQDFRVGPTQKAEIIQQFTARAVTGHSIASKVLTKLVNEQTQANLSPRTVRWHMNKLGLMSIKKTLPELVDILKKKLLRLLSESNNNVTKAIHTQKNIRKQTTYTAKTSDRCFHYPKISLSSAVLNRPCRRKAITVLANAGIDAPAIAHFMDCSIFTVRRWIQRGMETGDFKDRPRSGCPAIYTEDKQLKIVSFYCQTQPLPGCGRWTLRWAARHSEAHPAQIGASASKSTIHRILKNNKLKPYQSRYFLHITDPEFFSKMEHLVALFMNPPRFLFFFDECPGIQILKRLSPDLRTKQMSIRLEEFEYIRNGTMDVFAFLNNANGKIYAECHGDHKTATFMEVFRRHVSKFPGAERLNYVMDNLSSHCSYQFCQTVAELSGIECPPEKKTS